MKNEKVMSIMQRYIETLIDTSTANAPAWNIELKRAGKQNIWNYVDGCMITALLSLYEITEKEKYLAFCDSFMRFFVNDDGTINTYNKEDYNLDNLNQAKNLFKLYELTHDERYLRAIHLLREQIEKTPRTYEGNFWHKKIYPNQVWLDGLFMAQPFYMQYETVYNKMQGCRDSFMQLVNVERLMRDKKTGLYYHAYDESKKMYWASKDSGCSQNFWLRGMGWFVLAIVDTLEVVNEQMYYEHRKLIDILRNAVDAILVWQMPNGMFCQLIAKPMLHGNYCETSGTAIIAYAIFKAVRLGFLPKKYWPFAEKAFFGTAGEHLKEGENGQITLSGICLVAGLGGDKHRDGCDKYYLSEPIVENEAKGSASMLLCYTELLRTL